MSIRQQIADYFQDILGIVVEPALWQPARRLPVFLRQGYVFYEITLFEEPFLLMVDSEQDRTAKVIHKHIEQVQGKWESDIIYSRELCSSDERRRLIEQGIPFIIPGNQMYLPMLGIDLREHFRRVHDTGPTLAPAAQATVILLLTDLEERTYDAKQLAQRLGYSNMTASRSLSELQNHGLDVVHKEGKKRVLVGVPDKRSLWHKVIPLLEDPVSNRRYARQLPPEFYIKGGLTALSLYSMLSPSKKTVFAMGAEEWKAVSHDGLFELADEDDPEAIEVEVWKYDPRLLVTNEDTNACDPFSLYLSLKEHVDERVQICLDEMMKQIKW